MLGLLASAAGKATPLPPSSLYERDPELYWKTLRGEQFLLPEWRVFLNNGSLGVAPKPVVAAVEDFARQAAGLITDEYPRWGYETLDKDRTEMAQFVGCKKDELAFMHNATEAMSTIADGLELKAGDEVLITDQEHPSGRGPWLRKQARYGITVREVKIPLPPKSLEQLTDIVISALGPRTRVLSFSGILTTTGLIMPVRQICEAARAKGVLTVVDGAHMVGQVPVRLSELGCDLFAGSPHKWLFTPPGCGMLYIHEPMLERLWPSIVTGNWNDMSLKAARFMMVGTNNRSIFEGMMAGLRFHREIGSERIYGRMRQLSGMVLERAREKPYLEVLTPPDERMYSALVGTQIKPKDTSKFWELCKQRRIWTMKSDRLRISSHIHTRPSDIELLFTTMDESLGKSA